MNRFHIEVNMVLFFVRKNEPGGRRATRKHSANAHHRVTLVTRYTLFSGGSRWVERRMFMIWQLVGRVLWKVMKAVAWLVLVTFKGVLELSKLALLLFGLVARVFLIFTRAADD